MTPRCKLHHLLNYHRAGNVGKTRGVHSVRTRGSCTRAALPNSPTIHSEPAEYVTALETVKQVIEFEMVECVTTKTCYSAYCLQSMGMLMIMLFLFCLFHPGFLSCMHLWYLCFFDCQVDFDLDNVQCRELVTFYGV